MSGYLAMSKIVAAQEKELPPFLAGDVLTTVVVGMLIVFSVLAIIYFSMVIMERMFRPKKNLVVCPFDGVFKYAVAADVAKGDVVAVVVDAAGNENEILSPAKGRVKITYNQGEAFKKGDTLFIVE